MKAGKRAVFGAGVAAAAVALAACSSGGSSGGSGGSSGGGSAAGSSGASGSGKTINIAWFNPSATNTYAIASTKGLQAEAAKIGGKITPFDAKFDATTQINQVQDATASGKYKIFVILPLNNAGLVPAVQQARAKNIQVVSLLSSIGPNLTSLQSAVPGVITVGLDLGKNGVDMADLTIKACANLDPCKVAYMPGDPQQATDQIRTNAYNAELKKHSNIDVVSEQAGGFDAGTGLTTSQNILTAHPDLNVLAGASQPIAGAQQALTKAHLTGKVKLIANGGTTQDIQGIRDGTIFGAAVSLPMTEAETGLSYGAQALDGKTVPTATSTSTKSPVGATVTKETLSTDAGAKFTGEYSST